jgi:AmmeMemoRadiSam system protein A
VASDALLLSIARRSIEHGLATGWPARARLDALPKELGELGAAFVSLHDSRGHLRGCIGTLEAHRPLAEDVAENAWAAASRDPRFPPLDACELPHVSLHISLLTPPIPLLVESRAELVQRLRPGQHGLILEDRGRRATFVPDVWQGLSDANEFVAQLWLKAGRPADHWSPSVRAWSYEARSIREDVPAATAR